MEVVYGTMPSWTVDTLPCLLMLYTSLQDGYTPIHLASINGHVQVVEKLISSGADVNLVNKVSKVTTIFYHCWYAFSSILYTYVQMHIAKNWNAFLNSFMPPLASMKTMETKTGWQTFRSTENQWHDIQYKGIRALSTIFYELLLRHYGQKA